MKLSPSSRRAAAALLALALQARFVAEAHSEPTAAPPEQVSPASPQQATDVTQNQTPTLKPVTEDAPSPADYRSAEGYQKARWGMSQTDVRALYPQSIQEVSIEGQDLLVASGPFGSYKSVTAFGFVSNKLTSATTVLFRKPRTPPTLSDYASARQALSKIHGRPASDVTVWKSTGLFSKGQHSSVESAIEMGDASRVAKWQSKDSLVELVADGDVAGMQLHMSHRSRTLCNDSSSCFNSMDIAGREWLQREHVRMLREPVSDAATDAVKPRDHLGAWLSTVEEAEAYCASRGVALTNKKEDLKQIIAPLSFDYVTSGGVNVGILQFNSARTASDFASLSTNAEMGDEVFIAVGRVVFGVWGGADGDARAVVDLLKQGT